MPKQDFIEYSGLVTKVIPGGKFLVNLQLENMEHQITAHLSGKMRMHKINVLEGDQVTVEMSHYDITQGRIIFRKK
jgi:translation initiation factor IF-1